ncbi:hypothetical protein BC939DRAFT_399660 [Gamsiella multidivaricata]|uniref:uncharacterized protein n=1 Tax=Gamsiella multidivaricata TaxID=101098 RepID=UPI00221E8D45|nr:uncharacterized protein BC939DRAFT_399660 [Gamsiella multidivaricata]KAI7820133.1 hypothetical protein BC939DRAFT_399660 [Gamsiella multidivaricata]
MPNGIVSVWTHKAILPEVVNTMQGLGCRYVENLVWYKMALNNTNLDRASPYFRTSKEILLLFKKVTRRSYAGDGFDIRHQRTADVIIDFEKPTSSWIDEDYTEPKPDGVFEMMEIMLPDARYTPEAGRGRLLELWAKKSQERRPGWFSIHELKHTSTTSAAPSSTLTATASTAQTAPLTLTASPVPNDSRIPVSPESASGDGGDTDSIDDVALLEIANDMDLDFNE